MKIGAAQDVVSRLRALVCSIPEGECEPLAWIETPLDRYRHEAAIHHALRMHRGRGEWFKDCQDVRRFIARYGKPWPT